MQLKFKYDFLQAKNVEDFDINFLLVQTDFCNTGTSVSILSFDINKYFPKNVL